MIKQYTTDTCTMPNYAKVQLPKLPVARILSSTFFHNWAVFMNRCSAGGTNSRCKALASSPQKIPKRTDILECSAEPRIVEYFSNLQTCYRKRVDGASGDLNFWNVPQSPRDFGQLTLGVDIQVWILHCCHPAAAVTHHLCRSHWDVYESQTINTRYIQLSQWLKMQSWATEWH